MTYQEVIDIINNAHRFGKACGRDVTMELLEALGHPEEGMEVIHIAGTNGKGSVAAFVSSILQAAFSVDSSIHIGTFTSPHLIDFTERIMVDGVQIPQEDARRIGQQLLDMKLTLEPTMFDYCLAMALIYFKERQVRYLVLETGLGGSKDSTRGLATIPQVCAITSIGLEHTAILGDTLEAIAGEKAGIIRPGAHTVIGQMDKSAETVIVDTCKKLGCTYSIPEPLDVTQPLGLFGSYQRYNGALAAEICRHLSVNIPEDIIAKGLAEAVWPGRMQILSKEPFIMVDGAHNPSGVKALFDSLSQAFLDEKFTFIMAVMADKDYLEMAHIIGPLAARFYTCSLEYDRALQSEKLALDLNEAGFEAYACKEYKKALQKALDQQEKIIVFGSLYFIGEVLKDYKND